MKVHNNLKELLEAYNKHLLLDQIMTKGRIKERLEKFIASNSLALGKPEPLAKNKQTENSFFCDMEFTLGEGNRCKLECLYCRNTRLVNECRDATSR